MLESVGVQENLSQVGVGGVFLLLELGVLVVLCGALFLGLPSGVQP